jgi:hypothetical protein
MQIAETEETRVKLLSAISLGLVVGLALVACQGAAAPTPAPTTAVDLILTADTVQGSTNLTDEEKAEGLTCVQKNLFAHNEEIVWRAKVIDPTTGEAMDDQALSSVVVKLPDQDLAMNYGGHPHDSPLDFFWTVSFDIPESYPTGTLDYSVVATAADGRTGTYKAFPVTPSLLTVTSDVRAVISQ